MGHAILILFVRYACPDFIWIVEVARLVVLAWWDVCPVIAAPIV